MVRAFALSLFSLCLLFSGMLSASTDSFDSKNSFDVVILGAGPSGLAAALTVANHGLRVLVVENRSFSESIETGSESQKAPWGTRQRVVAVDSSAMDLLEKLCRCQLPFSRLTTYTAHTRKGALTMGFNAFTSWTVNLIFRRQFGGTIQLTDIEHSLYQEAKSRPNISFAFDTYANTIEDGFVQLSSHGQVYPVKTKLKINAEGASSLSLKNLGVGRSSLGYQPTEWLVANFDVPGKPDGQYHIEFRRNTEHPFYALALIANGVATVYASPYQDAFKNLDQEKAKAEIIQKTASLFGIQGRYHQDVTYFKTLIDRADSFSDVGRQFVSIGDAAHKVDPYSGFGVTVGVSESEYIQALALEISQKGSLDAESFARFDLSMSGSIRKVSELAKIFHGLRFWIRGKLGEAPIQMVLNTVAAISKFFAPAAPAPIVVQSSSFGKSCRSAHR